jgi:hypothetical protein
VIAVQSRYVCSKIESSKDKFKRDEKVVSKTEISVQSAHVCKSDAGARNLRDTHDSKFSKKDLPENLLRTYV